MKGSHKIHLIGRYLLLKEIDDFLHMNVILTLDSWSHIIIIIIKENSFYLCIYMK